MKEEISQIENRALLRLIVFCILQKKNMKLEKQGKEIANNNREDM